MAKETDYKAECARLQQELDAVYNSASFKAGRAVTWLPRKVRGGVLEATHIAKGLRRSAAKYGLAEGLRRYPGYRKYEKFAGPYYAYWASLKPEEYEDVLKEWFKSVTGETLDLEHPATYNQKVQWLKLYGDRALYTRLADKVAVRDWVKEKIGEEYLTRLYGVWDHFDEIDFSRLPDKFALKTNHGAGWNIIVPDKSKLDMAAACKNVEHWLKLNYAYCIGGLELQYEKIPPKVFAEEYLENTQGDLYDYKFYCFDGKVEYIRFIFGRFSGSGPKMVFFDKNWNWQPFNYEGEPIKVDAPRPDKLDEMIELAQTLAQGFPAVRVDLYQIPDGSIKLGEMTFTPHSGIAKWYPPEANRMVGDKLILPDKKQN